MHGSVVTFQPLTPSAPSATQYTCFTPSLTAPATALASCPYLPTTSWYQVKTRKVWNSAHLLGSLAELGQSCDMQGSGLTSQKTKPRCLLTDLVASRACQKSLPRGHQPVPAGALYLRLQCTGSRIHCVKVDLQAAYAYHCVWQVGDLSLDTSKVRRASLIHFLLASEVNE